MSAGQMKHANRWHLRPMRCCGLPTARTATLLLAALGLVSHLRLFSSIGTLQDSFPSVPLAQQASVLDVPFATLASGPQRVQESASNTSPAPSLLASPSLASGRNATQTTLPQADEPETWAWHNLLPHYHTGNADTLPTLHNIPDEATAGGRERQNWQSARLVTRTLRVYALLSAAASLAGVIGVLKPSLFATRLFVLSSFLDLFLFTLSLLALLVLLTNAEIRSQLCEFLSAGSLASIWDGDGGSGGGGGGADAAERMDEPRAWERVLEQTFTDENCDEAFTRDVIPIVMLGSLIYTAIRLYCFLVIHRWYMQLLRARIHHYFPASTSASRLSSTPTSPRSSSSPLLPLPSRTSTGSSSSSSSSSTYPYPSADETLHAHALAKHPRWGSATRYGRISEDHLQSVINEKLA